MRRLPIVEDPKRAAVSDRLQDRRTTTLVSICFVGTGVASLVAAGLLFILWAGEITAPRGWASAQALGLTHVLALGFVTAVAAGVLYHVAPLTFAHPLRRPLAGLGIWAFYTAGVGLFVAALVAGTSGLVVAGAATAGAAVLSVVCHLATVMLHRRRRTALHQLMSGAVLCLGVVAALGVTLAVALDTGALADPERILGAKIVVAIGGWLGLLITGFLYQLQPMFSPTRSRPRFRGAALAALACGVLSAALAILVGAPAAVRALCALPFPIGASLLAVDLVRSHRRRLRSDITPVNVGQLIGVAVLIVDSVLAVGAMSGEAPWPELAVSTALLGWAPIEIAANATRILPFVIWQRRPPGVRAPTFLPARPGLGWLAVGIASVTWVLVEVALISQLPALGLAAGSCILATAVAMAAIGGDALRNADPRRRIAGA